MFHLETTTSWIKSKMIRLLLVLQYFFVLSLTQNEDNKQTAVGLTKEQIEKAIAILEDIFSDVGEKFETIESKLNKLLQQNRCFPTEDFRNGWYFVSVGLGITLVVLLQTIIFAVCYIRQQRQKSIKEAPIETGITGEPEDPIETALDMTEETMKIQKG